MLQSLYTAASGLKSQQTNIDTIANNIANINTTGFKASRVDFREAIYTAMKATEASQGNNLQLGHGALLDATLKLFKQGEILQSGRSLDFAIEGDGFFALLNDKGETVFTRDGTFDISLVDGVNYLTASDGSFVLDKDFNKISIPSGYSQLQVDLNGAVYEGQNLVGNIGLFSFDNPASLEAAGSNAFKATQNTGQPRQSDAKIRQGFYEASNVDLIREMTKLMSAQRAYSVMSRLVSTADEMEAMANNLRG